MRRYEFSLKTVLRVRRIEEALALQQVGAANRLRREAERIEVQVRARYEAIPSVLPPMEATAFHAAREDAARLGLALVTAGDRIERARAAQRDALGALTEAKRKVSVLERLDAAGRTEWLAEEARGEHALLDDFANSRFRPAEAEERL